MNPLPIPSDLPRYTRDYLAQLDRAVCASLHAVPPRYAGDPRIWVAGQLHNHTPDGTCKYMLHLYLEILEQTLS
jgi:hypothetical protein